MLSHFKTYPLWRNTSGWTVPATWLLIAAVVVGFALLWNLGGSPLIQPDEGRNAEVAREMKSAGAWLLPTRVRAAARCDRGDHHRYEPALCRLREDRDLRQCTRVLCHRFHPCRLS